MKRFPRVFSVKLKAFEMKFFGTHVTIWKRLTEMEEPRLYMLFLY